MNRRCEPDAHPWHPIDGTHQRQCADCGVWADVDENPAAATEPARVTAGQRGKVGHSRTAPAGALTPVAPGPRHESLGGLVTDAKRTPDHPHRGNTSGGE